MTLQFCSWNTVAKVSCSSLNMDVSSSNCYTHQQNFLSQGMFLTPMYHKGKPILKIRDKFYGNCPNSLIYYLMIIITKFIIMSKFKSEFRLFRYFNISVSHVILYCRTQVPQECITCQTQETATWGFHTKTILAFFNKFNRVSVHPCLEFSLL